MATLAVVYHKHNHILSLLETADEEKVWHVWVPSPNITAVTKIVQQNNQPVHCHFMNFRIRKKSLLSPHTTDKDNVRNQLKQNLGTVGEGS